MHLPSVTAWVNERLSSYTRAKERVAEETEALDKAEKELAASEEAQKLIQIVSQRIQQQAHDKIASIVSRCLEVVFDDPYEFKITFERKRGKTEARLSFLRAQLELEPIEAAGGGVVDVAAFALRLACLSFSNPPPRRLLVLDEPFKYVSVNYLPRVCEMLEELAEKLRFQMVIVTHQELLKIGNVVEL